MSDFASRALLARLVGFATVSRDSNLELIGFIRDYLAEQGVESELFHNPEGTKANLFATIGPNVPGGVVLSGHSDVVPATGQAWSSDPFALTRRGERILYVSCNPETLAANLAQLHDTHRLERLALFDQTTAWEGGLVLGEGIERHGF